MQAHTYHSTCVEVRGRLVWFLGTELRSLVLVPGAAEPSLWPWLAIFYGGADVFLLQPSRSASAW